MSEELISRLIRIPGVSKVKVDDVIKVWISDTSAEKLIPSFIAGKPVVIMKSKRLEALSLALEMRPKKEERVGKWRPIPGGVSIGHYLVTAGTNAVRVWGVGKKELLLSNAHVFAPHWLGAEIGDPVLQPGPYDGGELGADECGVVYDFIPITFTGINYADAALVEPKADVRGDILDIGEVNGVANAEKGMKIKKSGRTCGYREGEVIDTGVAVKVLYEDRIAIFYDQIITSPIVEPGDSGSLAVSKDNKAVGLFFAGSDEESVASPIKYIIRALNISFEEPPEPSSRSKAKLGAVVGGLVGIPIIGGFIFGKEGVKFG